MERVEFIKRQVSGVFLSAWGPEDNFRVSLDFVEGDSLDLSPALLSTMRLVLGENLANWRGQSLEISIKDVAKLPDGETEF